jgi:hypothetical protein
VKELILYITHNKHFISKLANDIWYLKEMLWEPSGLYNFSTFYAYLLLEHQKHMCHETSAFIELPSNIKIPVLKSKSKLSSTHGF